MATLSRALTFFGPDIQTMEFPAWDCLPYDRVSPNASVVAQRMTALSRLTRVKGRDKPSILLTTINAALQRVPARSFVATHALSVAPGNVIGMQGVMEWLELNGYIRASTVREPGDYAVRGGILIFSRPVWIRLSGSISLAIRWKQLCLRRANAAQRRAIARARSGACGGVSAYHGNYPPLSYRLRC